MSRGSEVRKVLDAHTYHTHVYMHRHVHTHIHLRGGGIDVNWMEFPRHLVKWL